jgi:predicted nucleic acid-binding protein
VIKAIDTTFLIQLEVRESDGHENAHRFLQRGLLDGGHQLGLVPQVLEEFIHVCTDPRRFERPLSMTEALDKADFWWRAAEVQQVLPSADAVALFLEWMRGLRLGRRRIHDTLLAATCVTAGIQEVVTSDKDGFQIFADLTLCDPLDWRD